MLPCAWGDSQETRAPGDGELQGCCGRPRAAAGPNSALLHTALEWNRQQNARGPRTTARRGRIRSQPVGGPRTSRSRRPAHRTSTPGDRAFGMRDQTAYQATLEFRSRPAGTATDAPARLLSDRMKGSYAPSFVRFIRPRSNTLEHASVRVPHLAQNRLRLVLQRIQRPDERRVVRGTQARAQPGFALQRCGQAVAQMVDRRWS